MSMNLMEIHHCRLRDKERTSEVVRHKKCKKIIVKGVVISIICGGLVGAVKEIPRQRNREIYTSGKLWSTWALPGQTVM